MTPVLYRALAVLSLAASTTGLAALGTTEEDAYEDVTGETTWTHELPVEGLEEGTYNVLVRATDNAGNQSFSRATDIRIDPASDVPQLSVSIPEPGAVVGDRLLVLGTAVDDDAVASVFVGVNDDPPLPAEGAEYWSRQIDLSELEDGPHELVLSAVDENGTASPEQRIPFILDTGGPAVSLAEPAAGSTLGGRVRVSGTVRDPNGLVEIRFRAETGAPDGEAGSPQAADPQATDAEDDAPEAEAARRVLVEDAQRVRRRRPERDFSFRLDTRDIADGPIVVWVEATDVNGNTSSTPALYFVDNDSPGLSVDQLNNEGEADFGEGVPGELILSGRVLDTSGIASFTYQVRGEDPVEIPLEPGEADWLVRIDLTEQGNNARVDLRLTDLAGNTSEQRISVPIDEPADTPVIELSETADPLLLAGTVGDDDGVELLELQIDGQDGWTPVEHDGVFALDLRDRLTDTVPAGPLELQLRATDVNGRMSEVLEFERTVPADPSWIGLPQLLLTGPEDAADTGILPPRFTLPDGWRAEVAGEVVDGERPDPDRELRYRIDGGDWQRERPTDGAWLISLPRNQDPGTYRLELELIVPGDEPRVLDRLASGYEVLAEGAALPAGGSELLIDDARLTTEGASAALRLSGARPLVAGVADRDLTEARLEPGVPGLEAAIQDGQAVVSASSTLEASEQVLVVTDGDGTEYRSASFSVLADRVQPVIGEVTPEAAAIRATLGLLAVPVSDETTGLVVEGALNGGDFVALSAETTEEGATSWQLALDAAPADGPVFIELRATDRAGNVASRVHALRRDTTPPEVALLSPGPGVSVNGRVTLALALSDPGGIAAVEWIAGDGSGPVELEPASLIRVPVILPELDPEAPEQLTLLVRDRAGNENRFTVPLEIDAAADEPTVTIQLPEENAVVREPFAVSGTVIDDDGVAEIFYRVGEGPQQSAGEGTSFAFELNPEELGDNEQQIAVWARDPGGVESEPVLRTVRVSRAAPEGRVESPSIDSEVRGLTRVQGVAEDANGIGLVEVSIDNGVSFATALPDPELGWERWSYELDTAVLADGLHALQVRVQDSYETPHVFSHLVTVDNTAPELVLDEPVERHIAGETLPINGRALDGGEAAELEYRIQTAAGAGAWQPLELLPGGVIRREIEVPAAPEGAGDAASFNLRLRAADPAGNVSELSRTIRRATRVTDPPALRLVAPVDGVSAVRGVLVAGVVPALGSYDTVVVSAGDQFRNELEPDDSGYFWLELSPEDLGAGEHRLRVEATSADGAPARVRERRITFREQGPWVSLDSHRSGELVGVRPELSGTSGSLFPEPEGLEPGSRAYRRAVEEFTVERVELSVDNGRSFSEVRGTDEWRYRLDTQDLPDGPLPLVLRAVTVGGEEATSRVLLRIDTRPPSVEVARPAELDEFNDPIFVSGSAGDESGLERVEVVLREGSRNRYEVPEFIQGLYLDVHALGATQFDVGLGLTFFEDNVKLQAQLGSAPSGRFSGTVVGGKLLANVASLPASFLLGPDWDFLSGALAIGANFSYFSMAADPRSDSGLVLGGLVSQLEFPIISRQQARVFNAFSFYTELQFWFISSDVEGGTETKLAFGLRTQLL